MARSARGVPEAVREPRYIGMVVLVMTILGGYLLVRELPGIYANLITTTWPTVEAIVTKHRLYSKKLSSQAHRVSLQWTYARERRAHLRASSLVTELR